MQSTRRHLATLLAVALVPCGVGAGIAASSATKPTNDARPPTTLTAVMRTGAPGAIAVIRTGETTQVARAGVAVLDTRRRFDPDTPVRVGSITKTFVAVAVLQLAAEHRLSLDDTVERWAPGTLSYGRSVTIRHLLQHRSGVPDHLSGPATGVLLTPLVNDTAHRYTPAELVGSVAKQPQSFSAGTRWQYSNTNYVILGTIVERSTGRPLRQVLAERIFRPAGLAHTSFADGTTMPRGSAHGYLVKGNPVAPTPGGRPFDATRVNPSYTWAAGAIVSTAGDIDRFLRALLRGDLLSPSSLGEMRRTRPIGPRLSYGLGLLRIATPCGPLLGHNGMVFGYSSIALATSNGRHTAVAFASTSHTSEANPDAAMRALTRVAVQSLCPR